MAAKFSLDSFDKKILDCLQDDADMALAEVARRVGLSTTPCWRRINRLQEAGIVRARVALLDRKSVNAAVTSQASGHRQSTNSTGLAQGRCIAARNTGSPAIQ